MRRANIDGGPLDGRIIEVRGARIIQASHPPMRLEGNYEDGSPRMGYPSWIWRLEGNRYSLVAEPVSGPLEPDHLEALRRRNVRSNIELGPLNA